MQRLKYEKFNNSNDVITIDLHNWYTIMAVILKQISMFLEEGFFDYYIQRYKDEMDCFDMGNDLAESERLNASWYRL